jgi:hypothetical protein
METQFSLLNVVNVVNGFHRKFWLKSALHLNIAVFTLNFLPYTGPVMIMMRRRWTVMMI